MTPHNLAAPPTAGDEKGGDGGDEKGGDEKDASAQAEEGDEKEAVGLRWSALSSPSLNLPRHPSIKDIAHTPSLKRTPPPRCMC